MDDWRDFGKTFDWEWEYKPRFPLFHMSKDLVDLINKTMGEKMSDAVLKLKMCVGNVSRNADNNGDITSESISFNAVYSDKEGSANKLWSKWTPSASLTMQISNPGAFNKVLPGQFVFCYIIPTDQDSL